MQNIRGTGAHCWSQSQHRDGAGRHVWSNFEFIDEEGKVNEVDALILTPSGVFLVEIKSRPGVVAGDAHTWSWVTDGRERAYDNPLILANRKSKRLASLLRRQSSAQKTKVRLPFVALSRRRRISTIKFERIMFDGRMPASAMARASTRACCWSTWLGWVSRTLPVPLCSTPMIPTSDSLLG
ncbi:NERD domain-containing protein [Paraburkholderia elongata]|uniref:NERD domain-containing protein n=1 Tax=Paraburkholderia elongata TaxID=2675747 RepID=UPI001C1321CE|nr:NERD domain-containing protein [Paraburkholderia elongata]